eukprot:m.95668 g.95668  ORF g.95668 m.95668 type:complete len:496 (-) comp12336_c0_seq1:132-1619(-)
MGRGNGATGEHIDKATVIAQRLLETLNGMTFDVPDTSKAETAAADAVSQHIQALEAENRGLKDRLAAIETRDAALQADSSKAKTDADADKRAKDAAERELEKLKSMVDALAAALQKANKALRARQEDLARENEALLAENRRLGGTGRLPDTILESRSALPAGSSRGPPELTMASENAGLEATNANLLALNAALTVENRLLKRLQEEADQRDGDLARARAKAKADAERAARNAAAERQQERDEAERRAREKAAEGAKKKSSPKSPKRKRDKKLSELGDGFYTLPNEKVKRFVRVVGDQVMVRGGGGFYTLEQYIQGHVRLEGSTAKERKAHLSQLVQDYKDALTGKSTTHTTELPSHYYKNFTDKDSENERRDELAELLAAPPKRESLITHFVDMPQHICPREKTGQRRRSMSSSHGSYHSLDLADGLPYAPSSKMPHGHPVARGHADGAGHIVSKGYDHVKDNIPHLKRSLSGRGGTLLAHIPESDGYLGDVFTQ